MATAQSRAVHPSLWSRGVRWGGGERATEMQHYHATHLGRCIMHAHPDCQARCSFLHKIACDACAFFASSLVRLAMIAALATLGSTADVAFGRRERACRCLMAMAWPSWRHSCQKWPTLCLSFSMTRHALLPALQLFCAVIITPHTHAAHADTKAAVSSVQLLEGCESYVLGLYDDNS